MTEFSADLMDNVPCGFLTFGATEEGANGRVLAANNTLLSMLGYDADELKGKPAGTVFTATAKLFWQEQLQPLLESRGDQHEVYLTLQPKSGLAIPVVMNVSRSRRRGEIVNDCIFVTAHQRTRFENEVLETRNELEKERRLLRAILDNIHVGVAACDEQGRLTVCNSAAAEYLGLSASTDEDDGESPGKPHITYPVFTADRRRELTGDDFPLNQALNGKKVHDTEIVTLARNGGVRTLLTRGTLFANAQGQSLGAVLAMQDISHPRSLEMALAHQASHDALTGLINRCEFETRLRRILLGNRKLPREHALLYLDLDQFKIVNDTCGHSIGDHLLKRLAGLLHEHVRDEDTIARLGGDEFAIIMERCTLAEALEVAETLLAAIRELRFQHGDKVCRVGASVGVVPIQSGEHTVEELLKQADHACYVAKDRGRDQIVVHELRREEIARSHAGLSWAARLHQALDESLFTLYYQTISPIDANATLGDRHEILLRLEDSGEALIRPDAFLASAERYGLMPAIDRWVIQHTLHWLAHTPAELSRSASCINVSAKSLSEEHFDNYVIGCLETSGVCPSRICFEITETAAVSNIRQTLRFMERLRERGAQFALDDFGTGMASYEYLKMLPVDVLKIDGSFIEAIERSRVDFEVVRSINEIGHLLGMKTVAECVTSQSVSDLLRDIGVDYAQGYHIAYPKRLPTGALAATLPQLN